MSVLDTILGWFGGKNDEGEVLIEAAPPPRSLRAPTPPPATGPIDFPAVLASAGVVGEVRDRVTKAKQLLGKLPPDAKPAVKRQIVEAAFQAFDIPTAKIVEGATAEVDALRDYIRKGEDEKSTRLADGARRIGELEGEIAEVREAMDQAVAAQERRERLTTEEIDTVAPIVQFFLHESTSMPPPPVVDIVHDSVRPFAE